MQAIRPGERGPAVEDIQRRLRQLGYDIGPTGVDGVFLGATAEAVRTFQSARGLHEDAVVGEETWSALVDATFRLGDRMLYLRLPHLHGHDVQVLQQALNALGFACGRADGIFGTFSERALGEFQRNAGLVADGIAGDETIGAILGLRHVWEGKEPRAHSAAHVAPARAQEVLTRVPFAVGGQDEAGRSVASRVVNLALATTDDARTTLLPEDGESVEEARFVLWVGANGTASAAEGRPVVRMAPEDTFPARFLTACESARSGCARIVVDVGQVDPGDERALQRTAVRVLDAVCLVFG